MKDINGFLRSDSAGKAKILKARFQSAFTVEDVINIPSKGTSKTPSMADITINVNGIRKLLQNLKTNKATVPDSIPAALLKNGAEELAPVRTRLFQLS